MPREALNKEGAKTWPGRVSHNLLGVGRAQLTGDVLSGEQRELGAKSPQGF